jgi:predicted RNA-binding Zn ribbon-like protein
MKMAVTEIQPPIFEFSGNHLCLDFSNTLNDRASKPRESLNSYSDLVLWSQEAHILTENEARHLYEEAAQHQAEAAAVLRQAIDLREAFYRIFDAIASGSSAEEADLAILNAALSHSMAQACIIQEENGFTWDWVDKDKALNGMLWPLVRLAADLLTSEERHSVRVCASNDCGWLFLDTSKNHSRRWCDMKSCGNRAKVRKHYLQKKQSS